MLHPARLYRWCLKLYPARFRDEYAKPLEQQFRDEYRETRGIWSRIAFWARTVGDLAMSIPVQVAREVRQDVVFGLRTYAQRPLIAILALSALALSIGATTGVFSVVNALLLRSLPFREPERLIRIENPPYSTMSRKEVQEWRSSSKYLEDVAVYDSAEVNLLRGGEAVRVKLAETSANFFQVFGCDPHPGRSFANEEDIRGKGGVAVIGHGLWQQLFGGDPRVIGSTIHLNGTPLTVVGVAPTGFDFPARTALWTPTTFDFARIPKTRVVFWNAFGRLKSGVTLAQARSMFEAEVRHLQPQLLSRDEFNRSKLTPLREELAGPVRQASLVLMGATAFVLLIACANVANLLLTRITERRHELVIRAALGAGRLRLIQQLITEGFLLSLAAAVLGMGVAQWASRIATAAQPAALMAQEYAILDWRVLGFATVAAVLAAVGFGVFPALLMARLYPEGDLIHLQPGSTVSGAGRLRQALIVVQVSLTVTLLAGAVVIGRAFLRLIGTDLGFKTNGVVTMSVSLAGTRYSGAGSRSQYYREVLDRLRAVPGVEMTGGVDFLPLEATAFMGGGNLVIEGGQPLRFALQVSATPGYFAAMGIPVVSGREFTFADQDASRSEIPPIIVNEEFVRLSGTGPNSVGRIVTQTVSSKRRLYKVVGVVRTVRYRGPQSPNSAQMYSPGSPDYMTLVARVHGNPRDWLVICRDAIRSVDPTVPVFDAKTLDDRLSDNLAKPRFYTTAILFLGVFALLLAAVGIYAVSSYSVVQRRQEIGVRIAVGAPPGKVRLLLLRQSLHPVIIGIIGGAAGAGALGRYLQSLLPSAGRVDTATAASAALLLVAIGGYAIWSATQRAIDPDPIVVLRSE